MARGVEGSTGLVAFGEKRHQGWLNLSCASWLWIASEWRSRKFRRSVSKFDKHDEDAFDISARHCQELLERRNGFGRLGCGSYGGLWVLTLWVLTSRLAITRSFRSMVVGIPLWPPLSARVRDFASPRWRVWFWWQAWVNRFSKARFGRVGGCFGTVIDRSCGRTEVN